MTPDTIVEHLNVFKDHLLGLLTGGEAVMMQTFRFERAKETLHWRIVPTVSFATHRGRHSVASLQCAVGAAAILAATVRAVHQPGLWLLAPIRCTQSIRDQRFRHAAVHRPADDFTGVKILNRRQKEPTFVARNVGDITHPDLIRCATKKLPIQRVRGYRQIMFGVGSDSELLLVRAPNAVQRA